ncbi:MAG: hypothetical protein KAI28_06850 [Sphingomonadales bacterium]|nr:hypothetical protein [Sphingomonadales bacterium]
MSKDELSFKAKGKKSRASAEQDAFSEVELFHPSFMERVFGKLGSRRLLPVLLAGMATAFWVGMAVVMLVNGWLVLPDAISIVDMGAISGGMAAPIVLFWLAALVYQRTDPLLERRLEIARGMEGTLAPIDAAEKRLDSINSNISNQLNLVEGATDVAMARIGHLEERFQDQVNSLFSATTDAEAKAASLKDMLKRERKSLEGFTGKLDDRIDAVDKLVERLVNNMSAAATLTVKESTTASEFSERTLQTLRTSVDEVKQILAEIGSQVDVQGKSIQGFTDSSRETMLGSFDEITSGVESVSNRVQNIKEQSERIAENISKQTEEITALSSKAGSEARQLEEDFRSQADVFSSAATGALSQASLAGGEFTKQASSMEQAALEALQRTEHLLNSARTAIEESAKATEARAADVSNTIANKVSKTAELIQIVLDNLDEDTTERVSDAMKKLEIIRGELENQNDLVVQTATQSADNLGDLTRTLADNAHLISSAANDAAGAMRDAGAVMDDRSSNLGQMLDDSKSRLASMEQQINSQREGMVQTAELTANTLAEAVENLSDQSHRLRDSANNVAGLVLGHVDAFESRIDSIDVKGRATGEVITAASQKLREENVALTGTIRISTDALGDAAEGIRVALMDFVDAERIAKEQTSEAMHWVSENTERLVGSAELFLEKTASFDAKLNKSMADHFATTSSLIIEGLNSAAIDVAKAIDTDIPDTLWKKYVAGDRSIFTRRAVKLGTPKTRKLVAQKMDDDKEFRKHALKFMRDFEGLMDQAMSTPGGNPLSVTLVSSDPGKLYVLLAQASHKLS